MSHKPLSVGEVEFIAHRLACEWFEGSEPIPEFSTRYPAKLESCLAQPFQSFGNTEFFRTLEEKASILFYLIIKNHPFLNGNKRLAVTITLNFLYKNGFWLKVSAVDLYKIAIAVAESRPNQKDEIVTSLNTFIKRFKTRRHV